MGKTAFIFRVCLVTLFLMEVKLSSTPWKEEVATQASCPYDRQEYQFRNKCNCSQGGCTDGAPCNEKTECARGWFAFSCIYLDLGVYAKMSHASYNDNNDLTCYTHTGGNIEVNFSEPIQFTWLRVVLEVKEHLNNVSLSFVGTTNLIGKCENPSILQASEGGNVLDVECPTQFKVSRLQVSGFNLMPVCSIHINGGRNLISQQVTILHSQEIQGEEHVPEMTDGDISCDACVELKGADSALLITRLANFGVVQYIFLYTLDTGAKNFTVSFRSSLDRSIILYPIAMESGLLLKISTANLTEPIQYIVITLNSYSLWVCEIEVYGECTSKLYGQGCEKMCVYTCLNDTCNYEGRCHKCAPGSMGKYCMQTTEGTTQSSVLKNTTMIMGPYSDHIQEKTSKKIVQHLALFLLVLLCLATATALTIYLIVPGDDLKSQKRLSDSLQIEPSLYSFNESPPGFQSQRRHSESPALYSEGNVDVMNTTKRTSSLSKLEVKRVQSLHSPHPRQVIGFTKVFHEKHAPNKSRLPDVKREMPRADPTSNVESQTRSSEVKRANPRLSLANNYDENVLGRNVSSSLSRRNVNPIAQTLQILKRQSGKQPGQKIQEKEGGVPKVMPRIIRKLTTSAPDSTNAAATSAPHDVGIGVARKGKVSLAHPESKASADHESKEREASQLEVSKTTSSMFENTMAFMTTVFNMQNDTKTTLEHQGKKDDGVI